MRKPILCNIYIYMNNKGADQPAHPCSLISTFVVCCLDSIITEVRVHTKPSLWAVCKTGWVYSDCISRKTGFLMTILNEPPHDKKQKNGMCAQRRDRSAWAVWSVSAVGMKKAWVLSYPLSTLQRLWSDWADAQADLSFRWAHMPFCWVVSYGGSNYVPGLVPLFGIDVWEHAYYLQYKNVRPDYVKAIFDIANWEDVGERLAKARMGWTRAAK